MGERVTPSRANVNTVCDALMSLQGQFATGMSLDDRDGCGAELIIKAIAVLRAVEDDRDAQASERSRLESLLTRSEEAYRDAQARAARVESELESLRPELERLAGKAEAVEIRVNVAEAIQRLLATAIVHTKAALDAAPVVMPTSANANDVASLNGVLLSATCRLDEAIEEIGVREFSHMRERRSTAAEAAVPTAPSEQEQRDG